MLIVIALPVIYFLRHVLGGMIGLYRVVPVNEFHIRILQKADLKWIMSGANAQKFFGINLDAEGGANVKQFIDESGFDLEKLRELLRKDTKEK